MSYFLLHISQLEQRSRVRRGGAWQLFPLTCGRRKRMEDLAAPLQDGLVDKGQRSTSDWQGTLNQALASWSAMAPCKTVVANRDPLILRLAKESWADAMLHHRAAEHEG